MQENQTIEPVAQEEGEGALVMSLMDFIDNCRDGLLDAVSRTIPPVYDGTPDPGRETVMAGLLRQPFPAQRDAVQALARLLFDENQPAAILNAEMGTGKTMMAIALATMAHREGLRRCLVLSPPHLVYKWRREVLETVPHARVTVLNGPDTLGKLLALRAAQGARPHAGPEFFVLGRVRMRMGYHWKPAIARRRVVALPGDEGPTLYWDRRGYAACPDCGWVLKTETGEPMLADVVPTEQQLHCPGCKSALWTLHRPQGAAKAKRDLVREALMDLPTIGPKSAERLINQFGEDLLGEMLGDNIHRLVNLMDEEGNLVFSDNQARRLERALSNREFSLGQGGYQASEFVKRYLPDGYFDLMVVDEGHEYKVEGSAQGQAMGVLANKARKVLLLAGTLMGGYATDLFYLLFRLMPGRMIEEGYRPNARGSLAPAAMGFMRAHGVLKDIYTETEGGNHKTARGRKTSHRVAMAPGFGAEGILRHVLPYTVFLKLRDIGGNVLPPYREFMTPIPMTADMEAAYGRLQADLVSALRAALRTGDKSLLGVVLNALLAWPETCFRPEAVKHPRTGSLLAYQSALLGPDQLSPKEEHMLGLCSANKARGRRTLVYTTYTGTRDTTTRLKSHLEREGFKVAVLRAAVEASRREEWLLDQVDRGVEVVITNPELVKTGLDMLEFPTICSMNTSYNVYTLQQAARRSWRIGQQQDVEVHFLGYAGTTQINCLQLMGKKVSVSQSTSGDVPESGLDVLNQDDETLEVALAKQLLAA